LLSVLRAMSARAIERMIGIDRKSVETDVTAIAELLDLLLRRLLL